MKSCWATEKQTVPLKIEQNRARIEQIRARIEQSKARIKQSRARIEQSRARIEQSRARIEQSRVRIGKLYWICKMKGEQRCSVTRFLNGGKNQF